MPLLRSFGDAMKHVPVGDPIWSSVGSGEPIDITVSSDKRCVYGASKGAQCERIAMQRSNYCEDHQFRLRNRT